MEILNLKGVDANKAQYTFLKEFWKEFGKTWYDIDDPKLNNGDTWERPPKKDN